MTGMDELVTWLRAQLDDDERVAREASPGPWEPNAEHDEVLAVDDITVAEGFALSGNQLRATVDHIVRWDPARVLAEVDAKRRILELHRLVEADDVPGLVQCRFEGETMPCGHVRLLALPYADRPGYLDEWRPA